MGSGILCAPLSPALDWGDSTRGGGRRRLRPLMGDQELPFLGGEADFFGLGRFGRAPPWPPGDRGGRKICCLQAGD